jgi:spore coat polysaccharide biosynthesis protein SpsF (cytidylyltransferase family)
MTDSTKRGCIVIIARLGSVRLKNKHLILINKKPIISYLIERIKTEFKKEIKLGTLELFIVTGNKSNNMPLNEIGLKHDIKTFFGNDKNIPKRLSEFLKENKFDFLISIDGDDIMCAPEGMRSIFNHLRKGSNYVKTINYPFGMNSTGFERQFLLKSVELNNNKSLETGWGWIFNDSECKEIGEKIILDQRLRFTLDYGEDLFFLKRIIKSELNILESSSEQIIQYVIQHSIFLENQKLNKEYWLNFNLQKQLEIKE